MADRAAMRAEYERQALKQANMIKWVGIAFIPIGLIMLILPPVGLLFLGCSGFAFWKSRNIKKDAPDIAERAVILSGH